MDQSPNLSEFQVPGLYVIRNKVATRIQEGTVRAGALSTEQH